MFTNYLLSTFRNIRKNFTFSAINIFGLGLCLTISLLLSTWVLDELSFDRFHLKANQIYRLSLEYSFGGQTAKTSVSPTALLPAVLKDFEEVETGVRVYNPSAWNPFIVRHDDKFFQEDHFYFADSSFFDVFSYRLLQGNPDKALKQPSSVILSMSMAKKYFGEEEAIGKTLNVNNSREYTITGVIEDAPGNSYLQYDFIASFSSLKQATEENVWWSANYQTFVVINPLANLPQLESKTNEMVAKAIAAELSSSSDYAKYNWTLLTDLHLKSEASGELETVSDMQYVYLFSSIALLVLLIACINYVNLSTARATDRAKEVGVRKVVGASKTDLVIQFLGESIAYSLISFAVAMLVAQLLLPGFNAIANKNLSHSAFFEPGLFFLFLVAVLIIGLLSGIYPALAITAFNPVKILKGNFKTSSSGVSLRESLVVFQFLISMILIVGTIGIVKQFQYVQEARLGYEKENVLVLPLDNATDKIYPQLRNEFLRTGAVQEVSRATESPTQIKGGYSIQIEGKTESKPMITTAVSIDENFIKTMAMEFVAGNNLTEADMLKAQVDTVYSFILNESAIKELILTPEQAIGTSVRLNGRRGEIKGVVKDFHFASLHQEIGPLVFFNQPDQYNYIFVKLKPGNVRESLQKLGEVCANLSPHRPFEYEFIDEQYYSLYEAEQKTGVLASLFSGIAIVIASLGLLGLVSFSTGQRKKEIAIRKVLGASILGILSMITKGYSRLVFISIALGIPISYWIVNTWWLSSFAYRTEIGTGTFVLASMICLIIAIGAAGYQAMKAAVVNPTDSLRSN